MKSDIHGDTDELAGQRKTFWDGYNEGYKDGYQKAKEHLFLLINEIFDGKKNEKDPLK